jgi:hypothetical protein
MTDAIENAAAKKIDNMTLTPTHRTRGMEMTEYRPGIDPERRKGPDFWMKSLRWFAITGWLFMVAALLIFGKAKPQVETFIERYYNIKLRITWDVEVMRYIFFLMILGLGISVIGLVINIRRHQRKDDEYRVSMIILGLISLFGIFLYLFLF